MTQDNSGYFAKPTTRVMRPRQLNRNKIKKI